MLDDFVDVLREAVDVRPEVFFKQRVVFLVDLPQRPVRLVGERGRAGLQALHQLREFLFGKFGTLRADLASLILTPLDEDALQAAYHNDGQDDVLVLVGLELAAQPFGRLPDVTGEIVELGFVQGKGHCFASPIFCSRAAAAFDVKINATRRQLERIVGLTMKLDLAWLYYAAKILYLASPLLHLSILSAKGVV